MQKLKNERLKRLVNLMAEDNVLAFREFFDLLYPGFYRLAFYYVKSDMLSEELVSDVFLKIWNNRRKLILIEQLELYFFRSVKNQALTYLKRESRSILVYTEEYSSNMEYTEPENLLIAKELGSNIEEAISSLPERCEMIFRLVREDGMSYKAIAELLDISNKTVENQMTIALKKIKAALDDHYQEKSLMKKLFFFF